MQTSKNCQVYRIIICALFIVFLYNPSYGQTILITDSAAYTAKSSAMLDVQSFSKGMLVPRMSTSQRLNISNPADGLLVYDTDENSFYFNQGASWVRLSSVNESLGDTEPLFYVSNDANDTIFAVYNDGVKITLPQGTKGNVGGFAISGRTASKAGTEYEILKVNMDSTRIYVKDTTYTKGNVGGFAISGRTASKAGALKEIFYANPDSTRIFIDTTAQKGNVGGFAISGRSATKGSGRLVDLTHENYFIGQESGSAITTGLYNSVMGYQAGANLNEGDENVFIGYRSGQHATVADYNVFVGSKSGYSNTGAGGMSGDYNSFIGFEAGYSNTTGSHNSFLGYRAGYSNNASSNIFIGHEAGFSNVSGNANTLVGYRSGQDLGENSAGYHNTFIGYSSGWLHKSGGYNTYVGSMTGNQQPSGDYNCYFGYYVARNNGGGSNNVIMGHKAGYGTYLNAYSNNVFIGAESGYSVVSGSNNVFIGYQAGYNETGGNKLYIESTSGDKDDALIYGDFSTDDLQLNGNVRIANWTNAVSQTGLSIDVDGESTDTILKLRSNTTAGSWTDTDIKMVVYGDGSVYMPEVYVDNFSTGRDLYIASDGQLGYISSSKRYKEQITNMEDVGWIHQLRPVNFVYKKDERKQKQYGLIAEEVENVNREFVSYNKDGMVETVHYDKFISVLIKIVQEQDKKIENQQIENKSLQEELHLLKEQIEEINQLLSR